MVSIPFVDAHIHLWDPGRLRYPWLTPPYRDGGLMGSVEAIAQPYRVADYRNDSTRWNVAGAVHVDAGALAEDALRETQWLEELHASDALPTAIVAFAALEDPRVESLLERQAAHPHVRGIRQIVNWHPDPHYTYTPRNLLDDDRWQGQGFALLAKYGLSFDFQGYPGQFALAAGIFRRHPQIPVAVNHCGMPMPRACGGFSEWRAGMALLAGLPQVSVKISGFGIMDHGWSVDSIRPFILATAELFGADRCMFASDFPTDKLYRDFDATLSAYDAITANCSDAERRALFGRTANRFYRLGLQI